MRNSTDHLAPAQEALSSKTAILAETGDSWFNCQKLRLPRGCGFEFQMQYGMHTPLATCQARTFQSRTSKSTFAILASHVRTGFRPCRLC